MIKLNHLIVLALYTASVFTLFPNEQILDTTGTLSVPFFKNNIVQIGNIPNRSDYGPYINSSYEHRPQQSPEAYTIEKMTDSYGGYTIYTSSEVMAGYSYSGYNIKWFPISEKNDQHTRWDIEFTTNEQVRIKMIGSVKKYGSSGLEQVYSGLGYVMFNVDRWQYYGWTGYYGYEEYALWNIADNNDGGDNGNGDTLTTPLAYIPQKNFDNTFFQQDPASINGKQNLTISFRARVDTDKNVNYNHFVSFAKNSNKNYLLLVNTHILFNGYGSGKIQAVQDLFGDGLYHTVVFTTDSVRALYIVDGVTYADFAVPSQPHTFAIHDNGYWLGQDQDSIAGGWDSNQAFYGTMQEYRVQEFYADTPEKVQAVLDQISDNTPVTLPPSLMEITYQRYDNTLNAEYDVGLVNGKQDLTISFRARIDAGRNSKYNHFVSFSNGSNHNYLLLVQTHLIFNGHNTGRLQDMQDLFDDANYHDVIFSMNKDRALYIVDGNVYAAFDINNAPHTMNAANGGFWLAQDQDCLGGCFDVNQAWYGEMENFAIHEFFIDTYQALQAVQTNVAGI